MNFFAVVKVIATMCLFGFFTRTLGHEVKYCYVCVEGDVTTCEKAEISMFTTAACDAADATTQCYGLKIKNKDVDSGILRGCVKSTDCAGVLGSSEKYAPLDEKSCRVCKDKDNFNDNAHVAQSTVPPSSDNGTGNDTDKDQQSLAGSAVLWALLSSMVVARKYSHTM
ncbi:uncharacterized protein LOC100573453 [Acyrthosiphon pisum]|uniref:Uncharacterized protein n=1 Tax=Acyrthosiphon pisum TaxID=7029 RepID=A0A8R1W8H1_ACYPI|nr:uncharacterized protein LOC100573453 [Acyrthosiphon pisum]|eukprot:XP_003245137.1 PREDICTED: uncharacterized protein LOC100573453 [Acyrthosiphon pisum]